MACMATLLAACSQKQNLADSLPTSHIDIEQLNKELDLDMDISGLPVADLRVLRNAPAARQGYPFKDAYLRGIYQRTTWYDSLMWKFDETIDFGSIEQKENEGWRDYYYRASEEAHAVKYTQEELAFIKRIKEREDELLKQNFDVEDGMRVNMQNLVNPMQLENFDSLLCRQLATDGFAIVEAKHEQLFHVYEQNDYTCFPNFVTTDLYLQLYHLYVDCLLREIEEQSLASLMTDFTRNMYQTMHQQAASSENEEIARASNYNAVFFCIAYKLLTGQSIGTAEENALAKPELQNIMDSNNDYSTLLDEYRDVTYPYSLYRPRGHYTRTEGLQRYFRGMMWLQSAPFGLDTMDDVKRALVIAAALENDDKAQRSYQRVNQLLTFFMGKSDDISIPQVQAVLKKQGTPLADLLGNSTKMGQVQKELKSMGEKQIRIRPKFSNTSPYKVCVMPQRYQPDAEVLQEMVDYDSPQSLRPVPKGLDVFAAMGVTTAEQILIEEGQKWKDFKPMLGKMKKRMQEIDWKETIITQWMNTLKVMNDKEDAKQLPYFMLTTEWDKKNLNAALASWAELKHDAILYAKQPMGAECGGGGLPAPVVKGYVEPNIGFWRKAIELLDNTLLLIKQHNMLSDKIEDATTRIREEAQFLLNISEKELAGKTLSDEENDQLKCIGATFENISLDLVRTKDQFLMGWSDIQGPDRNVALVADVYTANANNNPNKSILFEAVGPADEIYVVVEVGGCLYLTRGAVLSYREFTQPLDQQRLTDEEWQEKVKKAPRTGVPEWMNRIIVPLKKEPTPNEEFFYSSGC